MHQKATSKLDQLVTFQQTQDSQHASKMNHGPIAMCHFSEEGHCITWTQAEHWKLDNLGVDWTFQS
jgi:hypothetical protein